jgi:hypothetical protein
MTVSTTRIIAAVALTLSIMTLLGLMMCLAATAISLNGNVLVRGDLTLGRIRQLHSDALLVENDVVSVASGGGSLTTRTLIPSDPEIRISGPGTNIQTVEQALNALPIKWHGTAIIRMDSSIPDLTVAAGTVWNIRGHIRVQGIGRQLTSVLLKRNHSAVPGDVHGLSRGKSEDIDARGVGNTTGAGFLYDHTSEQRPPLAVTICRGDVHAAGHLRNGPSAGIPGSLGLPKTVINAPNLTITL